MGRMKKEGWIRKVLSIFECQVETRAVTRPGNSTTAKLKMNASKMPRFSSRVCSVINNSTRNNFPAKVRRVANMRRKNLQERSPPSGKILHGPVFRALAKPKLAVKRDVAYVTKKNLASEPISERIGGSVLPSLLQIAEK